MQEWDAEDVKMERELELHQRMQLEAAKQAALKAQVSDLVIKSTEQTCHLRDEQELLRL